ncbi:MAG: DUF3887 domain-containing protein [Peptococcia bacterium]
MKLRFKALSRLVFVAMLCVALLTSCGSQKLSEDFNEDEVRSAAENVIALINNQDSEGLKEICTVQMKQALTDDVLEQIFEAIAEGGEFQEVTEMSLGGTKDKASEEEFAVVIAKAKYEIKTFTYTISFTKQMKLAGLYYR